VIVEMRRVIDAYFPHSKDMAKGPYDFHDYPWLDLSEVSESGREIKLLIKFWAGGRFCCGSPGCRFGRAFDQLNWNEFRELLRREGIEPAGTIKLIVRVVYEKGALFARSPGNPDTDYDPISESSWAEYERDEAQQEREQYKIVRSS
jgi:hypothetical protein